MRYAVTGASGSLGLRVADLLLDAVPPDSVVLITRRPDSLAELAVRGAEIRFGDFDQPESLGAAFEGVDRLLLISTTALDRRETQHRTAIEAAVRARVQHVVYTSMVGAHPGNPAVITPSHLATETALSESGLTWALLRNSLYSEYQVSEARQCLQTGRLVHNRGKGEVAYVSRDDCAATAAAVLSASSSRAHVNATYEVTGPELFDAARLADTYRRLGGRSVETVFKDDVAFLEDLVAAAGSDDHLLYGAELVTSFGRAIREGWFASCTNSVALLTGRPPRSLREVLEKHRTEL